MKTILIFVNIKNTATTPTNNDTYIIYINIAISIDINTKMCVYVKKHKPK